MEMTMETTIVLDGLSNKATARQLAQMCEEYGEVMRVVKESNGSAAKPRHVAWITFRECGAAEMALSRLRTLSNAVQVTEKT
jgi:hypothetical protein